MITVEYKGHKITVIQRGKKVSAKVGGINIAVHEETAQDAIEKAKTFVDTLYGDVKACKVPVVGSVG